MGYYENKKNKVIYKPGKYPFELWNYYDKLQLHLEDKDNENINSILENKIEKYLSYTNNNVESINSYIKNQILFGTTFSLNLFNEIIKNLFLRYKRKRTSKEKNIILNPIIYKRNLSDFLIDLIKIRSNKFLLTNEQMKLLKHNYDEKVLFDLDD